MIAERGTPDRRRHSKCRQEIFPEQRWKGHCIERFLYDERCRDLYLMLWSIGSPSPTEIFERTGLSFLISGPDNRKVSETISGRSANDLNLWHEFENANPLTFRLMYIFTARLALVQ